MRAASGEQTTFGRLAARLDWSLSDEGFGVSVVCISCLFVQMQDLPCV
jgi:hypothetical protein